MTAPWGRFAALLLVVVLVPPVPIDGQTQEPISVVVQPFATSMGSNFGRVITAELTAVIDGMAAYHVVDWEALLGTAPQTIEFREDPRAELNCIVARQLAVLQDIDLVLCGLVRAGRTGFEIEAMVISVASGEEHWLPPATFRDRDSVVWYVLAEFERLAEDA